MNNMANTTTDEPPAEKKQSTPKMREAIPATIELIPFKSDSSYYDLA
jgi:hypothetical protein